LKYNFTNVILQRGVILGAQYVAVGVVVSAPGWGQQAQILGLEPETPTDFGNKILQKQVQPNQVFSGAENSCIILYILNWRLLYRLLYEIYSVYHNVYFL